MVIAEKKKSDIIKLYHGGYTNAEIVDKTGVSKTAVSNIIKKKLELNELINIISNKYSDKKHFDKLFSENFDKINPVIETVSQLKYLKYETDCKMIRRCNHIGQRKLLLSEVQFLTNNSERYCIYPGSTPGNKTHFLSTLFPNIKFILIDPNKFDLFIYETDQTHRKAPHNDIVHLYHNYPTKSNVYLNKKIDEMSLSDKDDIIKLIKTSSYKIFIIEDFMNNKYAELFTRLGNSTFISDIRSNSSDDRHPKDIDIYWNTSMMYNWINIIKPEQSLLKIRMPYGTEDVNDINEKTFDDEFKYSKKLGIDFLRDYKNNIFNMCKSKLYVQAWAAPSSSELRMLIEKKDINNIITYEIDKIEGRMFYFNLDRSWFMHPNKNANKKLNFCHCNDCSLENLIWTNYFKKFSGFGVVNSVYDAVIITNKITFRPLNSIHTGAVWEIFPKNLELLNETIGIYQENINLKNLKSSNTNEKKYKKHLGDSGK
jgi:hypothetical protein